MLAIAPMVSIQNLWVGTVDRTLRFAALNHGGNVVRELHPRLLAGAFCLFYSLHGNEKLIKTWLSEPRLSRLTRIRYRWLGTR